MLYAANLYCPCHTYYLHYYDEETSKPCIGLCGHTVCLRCIEENVHMACPICKQPDVFVNKTPNYAAIELINDCRKNFWQLMKKWWSGEYINSGPCSICSDQSLVLRICLTCDEDRLCTISKSERRLKMHYDHCLLNLSRHVLCSECAIKHHNGHETMNIERIKYAKRDIKKATSILILRLFKQEMIFNNTTKCWLRRERILSVGSTLFRMLDKLDYKEELECGYFGELIRMELITKYMEDIDRVREDLMLFSVGETSCECNRLYNKLKGTWPEVHCNVLSEIFESGIGMFSPGCPLFLKSQLENRLKWYEMIGETPPEQQVTLEPYNVIQCPLCVILDHSEHKKEHHRQNWLEIVENIWKNELPPLSNFCCRCLDCLTSLEIGSSCGKKIGYRWESCQKPNCLMKDPELWKYDIISKVHPCLRCIMRQGCRHENLSCQLKKIRLESSAMKAYEALCTINLKQNSREEFNLILKNVDDAFEQLKNRKTIYEAEIQEPECECSKLWNKNERLLKKLARMAREPFGNFMMLHLPCVSGYYPSMNEQQRQPYLKLKKSMEEMAEYSLKEEILGCPMGFDHGIVLDPIVLEELKNMDLEDSLEIMDMEESFVKICENRWFVP